MEEQYPKPKYPPLKTISKEEMIKRIKTYIIDIQEPIPDALTKNPRGHVPLYDFGKGDKILVVGATEYDPEVINGYAEAIRQKGAKADLLLLDIGRLGSPEAASAEEAKSLIVGEDNPVYTKYSNVISSATAKALALSEGYDMIVAGMGPPPHNVSLKWRRLMFVYGEEIAGDRVEFPLELQLAIDRKVWEDLTSLEKCHFTDPEGTDFVWTNYDDERRMAIGHEFAKPMYIGHGGVPDCSGTIAGTLNHVGCYPNIRATVKNDLVVKVEGGGEYGDAWRAKLEELNGLELPEAPVGGTDKTYKLPGPGYFWFYEMAIGTSPKVFRHPKEANFECFASFLHDRERSGYVHHGMGAPSGTQPTYTRLGIPWSHVHIHSLFGTLEGRSRNGERTTVINKGHLTALDDPEVRSTASRYGDPDELLKEIWIPAIPGINEEGDYWQDYAKNPSEWIRKEGERYIRVE